MYRDQFGEFACGCWGLKGQLLCLSTGFNYSHRIDVLSFGPWAPGYINPLDGDIVVTDKRKTNVFDSVLGRISCS